MSGASSIPASVTVTQNVVGPSVTVTQGPPVSVPAAPYALAADPSQNWELQTINGVLTWVEMGPAPTQNIWGLEDGDVIGLEDGGGVLGTEL